MNKVITPNKDLGGFSVEGHDVVAGALTSHEHIEVVNPDNQKAGSPTPKEAVTPDVNPEVK